MPLSFAKLGLQDTNTTYYSLLGCFSFFLPLNTCIAKLILLGLLGFWLYNSKKWCFRSAARIGLLGLFIALYAVYAIHYGLFQSTDYGWFKLEQKLSLLVFPLLFFSIPILKKEQQNNILQYFTYGCLISMTIMFIGAFYTYFATGKNTFFYTNLAHHLNSHPTYIAEFILLAYFYWWYDTWEKRRQLPRKQLLLRLILILWMALTILLLASRIVILLLGFISIASILFYAYKKRVLLKGAAFVSFKGLLLLLLLNSGGEQTNRFTNIRSNNSANARLKIWTCAADLVEEKPWFGYGIGAVKVKLGEKYQERGFKDHIKKRYDAHNQYIEILLSIGVLGLFVFLLNCLIPFVLAWRQGDYLFLCFLCIVMGVFLTESILERQEGIFFYAFFMAFFAGQRLKV